MRKKGFGLFFKKVVVRYDGSAPFGAPRSTYKVVRVEPFGREEMMAACASIPAPRRDCWVLQAMCGRRIEFEQPYLTRKEANSIARTLAFGIA